MTARLRRAAQRVIEEVRSGRAFQVLPAAVYLAVNELEHALPRTKRRPVPPSKVAKVAKRRERWDSDAAVRERVMLRDRAQCRVCGSLGPLELDHFMGRGRDRSDAAAWILCRGCHEEKTMNRPSRRWWLETFRSHVAPISAEVACRVDALLALDEGKRRTA